MPEVLKDLAKLCGNKERKKMKDNDIEFKLATPEMIDKAESQKNVMNSSAGSVAGAASALLSEPAISRKDAKGLSEEEEETISCNIDHLTQFLSELNDRKLCDLSQDTRNKIVDMKHQMNRWLGMQRSEPDERSGAIPKTRLNFPKVESKLKGVADSCSEREIKRSLHSDTSDELPTEREENDDSASSSSRHFRRSRNMVRLADVMGSLNRGRIPDCEKFDENSGQDLKKYLSNFEKYCRDNVNGGKSGWLSELRKNLSGRTLEAFKIIRGLEDNYEDVKKGLLEWYKESKDNRKMRYIKAFEEMKFERKEELYLYCCRLEKAYRLAYPKQSIVDNTLLQQKFRTSVSSKARERLNGVLRCLTLA